MNDIIIFTDGSMNPQLKIGVGGIMILYSNDLNIDVENISKNYYVSKIQTINFENTSSTKLEIETLLEAINLVTKELDQNTIRIRLFTDSQGITSLINRKDRLINNDFVAKSSGKELNNKELYIKFYHYFDKYNIEVNKVKGHSQKSTHDTISRIFSFLDKEVRRKLREIVEIKKNTLSK